MAKVFGLTAMLRDGPDVVETYLRYHRDPWPEVVRDGIACGIEESYIFYLDRRLFMYLKTTASFQIDKFATYLSSPRTRQWQAIMSDLMVPLPGSLPGLPWVRLLQVGEEGSPPGGPAEAHSAPAEDG